VDAHAHGDEYVDVNRNVGAAIAAILESADERPCAREARGYSDPRCVDPSHDDDYPRGRAGVRARVSRLTFT
jgi:hypothetical protein